VLAPIFARSLGEYFDPAILALISWTDNQEVKAYKAAISGLDDKYDFSTLKFQSFLNRAI
jgi:hypothetical protein